MSEIERILQQEAEHAEAHTDAPLRPENVVRRPGQERSKVLSVRLAPEEMAQLAARAGNLGIGPSTLARSYIVTALNRVDPSPDASRGISPEAAKVELHEVEDMLRRMLHHIEERQHATGG